MQNVQTQPTNVITYSNIPSHQEVSGLSETCIEITLPVSGWAVYIPKDLTVFDNTCAVKFVTMYSRYDGSVEYVVKLMEVNHPTECNVKLPDPLDPFTCLLPLIYAILRETPEHPLYKTISEYLEYGQTTHPSDIILELLIPRVCACGDVTSGINGFATTIRCFKKNPFNFNKKPLDLYELPERLVIGYYLDSLGHYIEHGSSIGNSHLTENGQMLSVLLEIYKHDKGFD